MVTEQAPAGEPEAPPAVEAEIKYAIVAPPPAVAPPLAVDPAVARRQATLRKRRLKRRRTKLKERQARRRRQNAVKALLIRAENARSRGRTAEARRLALEALELDMGNLNARALLLGMWRDGKAPKP